MGRKSPKLDRGAVLAIPVGPDKWALSQVLVPGIDFYLGAASKVFAGLPEAKQIEGLPLAILSWTNDAEVWRGNWKLLGSHEVQPAIDPDSAYKVAISGKMMVEAFNGQLLREYDPQKDAHLNYRTIRSPLLVQDKVQAACEAASHS